MVKSKLELGKMEMKDVLQETKHPAAKKIKALKDFPPESEVFLIAELLIAKKQIKDILQSW